MAAGGPGDEEYHAQCTAHVLRTLGPAAYEQALADGEAIDGPAQATAYALHTGTSTDTATEAITAPVPANPLTPGNNKSPHW